MMVGKKQAQLGVADASAFVNFEQQREVFVGEAEELGGADGHGRQRVPFYHLVSNISRYGMLQSPRGEDAASSGL